MNCKHCGQNIVLVNFALGPKWMHQPAEASFMDSMQQWCRLTTAEPHSTEGAY